MNDARLLLHEFHTLVSEYGEKLPMTKMYRDSLIRRIEAELKAQSPAERVARITLRNPDTINRCRIEINGQLEVLDAGEKMDIALAERDSSFAALEKQ